MDESFNHDTTSIGFGLSIGDRHYTGLDNCPCPDTKDTKTSEQCCVCMRKDQELLHLCLVNGGGNSLFSMLCDKDKEKEGNKDEPTWLIICWKCDTMMSRIVRFRQQAYKAQKRLTSISAERALTRNTFVLLPPLSGSRGSGPEAILEYRTHARGDPSQPLLRVVRYVLPDESESTLPPPREGASHSSLRELLLGIHQ